MFIRYGGLIGKSQVRNQTQSAERETQCPQPGSPHAGEESYQECAHRRGREKCRRSSEEFERSHHDYFQSGQ